MNTSEVLNKAADLIEVRGWTQGNCGMAVTGPKCLEGAIAAALGTETDIYASEKDTVGDLNKGQPFYDYTEALHASAAYRAVGTYLERGGNNLYNWNDRQGRTAEQVVATLRACAVIEAAKETADERVAVTV